MAGHRVGNPTAQGRESDVLRGDRSVGRRAGREARAALKGEGAEQGTGPRHGVGRRAAGRWGGCYRWIGGGCGGGEPAGRLFRTCMAIVIMPATSETLAGTTSVVDFWASWPNFSTYCSATRSCTAS
jgi:hypothetical protein